MITKMMIYKRFVVERKTINFLQPLFFYSHLDYKWMRFSVIQSSMSSFFLFFFWRKKRRPKNCCKIPEILKVDFSCHCKTVFLSFYEFNKVGTDTAPNKKEALQEKKDKIFVVLVYQMPGPFFFFFLWFEKWQQQKLQSLFLWFTSFVKK